MRNILKTIGKNELWEYAATVELFPKYKLLCAKNVQTIEDEYGTCKLYDIENSIEFTVTATVPEYIKEDLRKLALKYLEEMS